MGVLPIMLIFSISIWISTKDRILGAYNIYVLTCLLFAFNKFSSLISGNHLPNFMENTWSDDLFSSINGFAYIYFFGYAFQINKAKRYIQLLWKSGLALMIVQIIFLLFSKLAGHPYYYNSTFLLILLVAIFLVTCASLLYAVFLKNKSRYQKIIMAGAIVFFLLAMTSNLQEFLYKTSQYKGMSITFIAYTIELSIFAIASANHIKVIYAESEKLKLANYKHQLEVEQISHYFTNTINKQDSIEEMLQDVAENCISKLGLQDCVIYLINSQKKVLEQKAAWGPKSDRNSGIINPIEIPLGKGITGFVAVTGKAEIINDTALDSRYIVDDDNRHSEICVPIIKEGITIGVIDSEHEEKKFYTTKHLQILTTIAALCADKIDKIQAEQLTRQKEFEVQQLNQQLIHSEVVALRSQMNPHFIFNSLNSINSFILKNDPDNASGYLTKFSRLMRMILDNSRNEWVLLENELKALELYIELEALRFDNAFTYNIEVTKDIDIENVLMPPLLIQPYVENAIWHGLLHRKLLKGKLDIRFWKNDDKLYIEIEDNGVGREEAKRLKSKTATTQKSHGMKITAERIAIANKVYNVNATVKITDLHNETDNQTGTRVLLTLKYKTHDSTNS